MLGTTSIDLATTDGSLEVKALSLTVILISQHAHQLSSLDLISLVSTLTRHGPWDRAVLAKSS